MYPDLEGKVAIVSGAATLIGQKVVEAFAAAGSRVVAADINAEDGAALADRLGESVLFEETDLRDDAAIDRCIARAKERFGGLDCLVNVAAVYIDDGASHHVAHHIATSAVGRQQAAVEHLAHFLEIFFAQAVVLNGLARCQPDRLARR